MLFLSYGVVNELHEAIPGKIEATPKAKSVYVLQA
jgi:hypothetical protein